MATLLSNIYLERACENVFTFSVETFFVKLPCEIFWPEWVCWFPFLLLFSALVSPFCHPDLRSKLTGGVIAGGAWGGGRIMPMLPRIWPGSQLAASLCPVNDQAATLTGELPIHNIQPPSDRHPHNLPQGSVGQASLLVRSPDPGLARQGQSGLVCLHRPITLWWGRWQGVVP